MALSFLKSLPFLPWAWTSLVLDQASLSGNSAPLCNGRVLPNLPKGVVSGALGTNISIVSGGLNRSFLLHVPRGYDNTEPAPVYFSFHGADRNATEQELLSQFSNETFNPHGIAIYPQGLYDKWYSNPNTTVTHDPPNDLDFIADLLHHLNTDFCIDTTRIYAAGKSNGGGFTDAIACNSTVGPAFAAFASVSGAYYDNDAVPACDPGTAFTPFLEFHGLQDCVAPYHCSHPPLLEPCRRRTPQTGVPPLIDRWLDLNGCPPKTADFAHPTAATRPADYGSDVTVMSWDCATRPAVVRHYREDHLGHIWPSVVPDNDDCLRMHRACALAQQPCPAGRYVFDATEVIMRFFAEYSLPSARF